MRSNARFALNLAACTLLGLLAFAWRPPQSAPPPTAPEEENQASTSTLLAQPLKAKLDDLAWMTGHWQGTIGAGRTEQICSRPAEGEMMCVFRALDSSKVEMLELITLQQVGDEVELRVRHFGLDLQDDAAESKPIVLWLAKNTSQETDFVGTKTSIVKHSRLLRQGRHGMEGRVEFVDKNGKSGVIQVQWKRTRY